MHALCAVHPPAARRKFMGGPTRIPMGSPMSFDLKDARVLVTAGASGIGLATARAFAQEGARVHVCDVDRAALDALGSTDATLQRSVCDVADRAAVARLFQEVAGSLGGLDVLV